ncbi:MAG TPA: hypothetical protein VHB47_16345 [Thermoanaerobaculia bacterium]|jgi:hypothetical protein|nr:hypothetical protein [Thermoanaerobaculia bacterium]
MNAEMEPSGGVQEEAARAERPEPERPVGAFEYFIGLDLGSESMAACFQHRDAARQATIDLQARAEELAGLKAGTGMGRVDLLYDELPNDGRKRSHRLRTRISLREGQQPSPLPDEHARLPLVDGSETSIFKFFHLELQALASKLVPNPKLLFQTGISDVIPAVKAPGAEERSVQYEPAELLSHLTVQVVNNFVLSAKELTADARRHGQRAFDPSTALLTLTVPNVYSLTHVKELEDFVRRHTGVGEVRTMYESDAVAHFMIGEPQEGEPRQVQEMKQQIGQVLKQRRRDAGSCRVLTIDVGKGTTDLSLFNYDFNRRARSFTHDVLGRTGRSHGGARLSYILVEHLERRIQQVLERAKRMSGPISNAVAEKRQSVSLLIQPPAAAVRGKLLGTAEELVEAYKRALDENYRLAPEVNLLPLVEGLVEVIGEEIAAAPSIAPALAAAKSAATASRGPGFEATGPGAAASGAPRPGAAASSVRDPSSDPHDQLQRDLRQLKDSLAAAITFPRELPRDAGGPPPQQAEGAWRRWVSAWWRFVGACRRLVGRPSARPAPAPARPASDPAFAELRAKLEGYVRQNGVEPLEWLYYMANQREHRRARGRVIGGEDTFVVVAGQASRFKPLRKAIRERVRDLVGINLERQLLFLPDQLAKLACCFGAQSYYLAALTCNNPDEIMGTYGFLSRFVTELQNLDMAKFNQRDAVQDVSLMPGSYWLVYQPRAFGRAEAPEEDFDRGSMAYIRSYAFTRGGAIRVRYRGWKYGIEIAQNGTAFDPVRFGATYGNLGNTLDDIYRKTWPEAVRHEAN